MTRQDKHEDISFFEWLLFIVGLSFVLGTLRGFRDE
jgi:hypothetical protein